MSKSKGVFTRIRLRGVGIVSGGVSEKRFSLFEKDAFAIHINHISVCQERDHAII